MSSVFSAPVMERVSSEPALSILHIILALRPTNGQYNEHCLPLMDQRDITVCTYFASACKPPARITLFDGDNSLRGFFRALRAALKAKPYDVIHVHTPHAGVLLLTGLVLFGCYRKLQPSTVHTVQNSFDNFSLRNQLLFLPSFALFRHMVFCSHASYESFPKLLRWLAAGRISVVQNAVDLKRIDRQRNRVQADHCAAFTVVSVGLIDIKNPGTVLAAFRDADDGASALVFLGEGRLRNALSREIERFRLERAVTMTGMVPRNSVFKQFATADLFVSASRGEGLPVAVLEAMACGCPVVLSDIPPHREIAEGVDFIPLVHPEDAAGFAREIVRFRAMSGPQRTDLGRQCRKLVEDRFSLHAMHAGYVEIYARIVNRPIPSLRESLR